MHPLGILAVCIGASLGALLRWGFSLAFNPWLPPAPLGTLAANLIGGYLVGLSAAWLGAHSDFPPEVRLLVVTGFLGGLTTFSSYSLEVVNLLLQGRPLWGAAWAAAHLVGSFSLTAAGIASYRLLARQG